MLADVYTDDEHGHHLNKEFTAFGPRSQQIIKEI
jgi:hypothetical protein